MTKCKITIIKRMLIEEIRDEYAPDFKECPRLKEGEVYITGGKFGNEKPEGFCEYAWWAVSNIAGTLAGGGKVFGGEDFNIACCNDGIRPVIMKLEAIED